jgi:hypothetical protein
MKPLRLLYWASTGLLAAFMLMASVPDILQVPMAVEVFRHLGYPAYLLPFVGTAKILGVAAVLFPGFGRVKEWAYAGLVFDLTGALHSHLSVGDAASAWSMPILGLVLVTVSYVFYRKTLVPADRSLDAGRASRPGVAIRRVTPEPE